MTKKPHHGSAVTAPKTKLDLLLALALALAVAGCGDTGGNDAVKEQVLQAISATKECRESILETLLEEKGIPEDAEQAGCRETVAFPLEDLSVEDGVVSVTFSENAADGLALETLTFKPGLFIREGSAKRFDEEDIVMVWACGHSQTNDQYVVPEELVEINDAIGPNGTSIDPAMLPAECGLIEDSLMRVAANDAGMSEDNYRVYKQVLEGLNFAGDYKAGVSEYYANTGLWPLNTSKAMGTDAARFPGHVASVAVTNGTILIEYSKDADTAISGKIVALQPLVNRNSDVTWRCGKAGTPPGTSATIPGGWERDSRLATSADSKDATTVPDMFLPPNCRSG